MLQSSFSSAAPSVGNWFENAVLVYGPRKSGTTLLQNLLDSGEGIFVYPAELKLKYLLPAEKSGADVGAVYVRHARIPTIDIPRFNKAKYESLLNVLTAQSSRDLKSWIRADLGMVLQSRTGSPDSAPGSWCAKEVGGDTTEIVRWWLEHFKRPRVVLIVRDPKMIARAILNDRRRQGRPQSLKKIFYETMDSLRVLKQQETMVGRDNILTIAYEDLVRDTERTMARIARFLSIRFDERLTIPTIFSESVVVATASRPKKRVFNEEARWFDGLTWRERLAVRVFGWVAWLNPRLRVDYQSLRHRIGSSQY